MRALVVSILLATTLFVDPARAATGDTATAQQILAEVAASPQAATATAEVQGAQKALERAQSARDSGDLKHAEMLEGLARTWAESARDVLRAAHTEQEARELQEKAAVARAQIERERSLLEETLASRGRARAELERATAEAAARPPAPPPREKGRGKGKKARQGDETRPKKAGGKKK
jgi:multidrug efflux pump subunit AcrA (membrane-fusion protein)